MNNTTHPILPEVPLSQVREYYLVEFLFKLTPVGVLVFCILLYALFFILRGLIGIIWDIIQDCTCCYICESSKNNETKSLL